MSFQQIDTLALQAIMLWAVPYAVLAAVVLSNLQFRLPHLSVEVRHGSLHLWYLCAVLYPLAWHESANTPCHKCVCVYVCMSPCAVNQLRANITHTHITQVLCNVHTSHSTCSYSRCLYRCFEQCMSANLAVFPSRPGECDLIVISALL